MANTYTTQWFRVSNGDVTTHNPQSLAPTTAAIRILSADVQWEGVTSSSTSTSYSTNSNYDSATATETTDTASNRNSESLTESSADTDFPPVPSGYSFDYHDLKYEVTNKSGSQQSVDVSYNTPSDGTSSETITVDNNSTATVQYYTSITTNYVGEIRAIVEDSSIDGVTVSIYLWTYGTDTTVNSQTASTTYPSVPSGYSFDRHRHQEWRGGTEEVDEYIYTNQVGESESITSNDPNTKVEVELTTRGEDTTTTTYDTHDPRVTRDVSGSYTGTLDDGEQSPWITLSGLDPDSEEFYHDIEGSNEANFRFRFDWEEKYPTPLKQLRVYDADANAIRKVALADPTDSQLDYNVVRTAVNGTIYAVDVVDPSQTDAIESHRLYHSTHGILCPRAYDTV